MSIPCISAKSDVLDHLGLIAATISKLGLVEKIDKMMPMTKGAKTTHGQRALAMILNGLGFMDDRLYLFPKFLDNKPVSKLFGSGIQASDFHDDSLGLLLDAIHNYGEQALFSQLSLSMALQHNLLGKSVHIDTTTQVRVGHSVFRSSVPRSFPFQRSERSTRSSVHPFQPSERMNGGTGLCSGGRNG